MRFFLIYGLVLFGLLISGTIASNILPMNTAEGERIRTAERIIYQAKGEIIRVVIKRCPTQANTF